ncbi:ribosome assembly RNA-binding protein YhbY [bacterium]|nr:ribosome assembly RNA-binding protein YhbY [bacterium]NUN44281.1 ribosome assembly RNA-binding protein YhbY [bacterium]
MSELTGKQKRFLRGLGNAIKATISVGKSGITDNTYLSVNNGFNTKELIKVKVQDGCDLDKKEVAEMISEGTQSQIVQIIGNNILLYKCHHEKPIITLPD